MRKPQFIAVFLECDELPLPRDMAVKLSTVAGESFNARRSERLLHVAELSIAGQSRRPALGSLHG